jgi:uncharacterized protein YkwD
MRRTLPTQLRLFSIAIATLALSAVLILVAIQSVAAFTGCSAATAPIINAEFEGRVAQLVNQQRAAHGLPPLKLSASLSAAARYHATDMGVEGYFAHDTHDRAGDGHRRVCGTFDRISLWYTGWNAAAENIAGGYNTPEAAVAAWMDSDGHRNNMLSSAYTEFGVGYFTGGGKSYWVQDFGNRSDSAPMVLAGESSTTTKRDLDVYVHGSWSEIRLRNDNGAWTDWQPFANSFTWTIGSGRGIHVVSAELRSGGNMRATCDTIMLDVPANMAAPVKARVKLYLPTVRGTPLPDCE